jgi:hypothetical protein
MSREAERWLVDKEIALLEAMHELSSPTELEDSPPIKRKERVKVRATNSTSDRQG